MILPRIWVDSMRVLMTLLPATGSLHPLLPLAESVREAGHDVAFVSSPRMADDIKSRGFEFIPAGSGAMLRYGTFGGCRPNRSAS